MNGLGRGARRLTTLAGLVAATLAFAGETPPGYAVASAHPLATAAGIASLQTGGNAFDAAVAIASTLAVVEPYSSGLGGGGFFLLHRASDVSYHFLDARETAPAAAHRDMYLDAQGEPVAARSRDGALAAGIPGLALALDVLAQEWGQRPFAESLAAAITHAEQGFLPGERYRKLATMRLGVLQAYPASAEQFLIDGAAPGPQDRIRQPDLARTLKALAEQGRSGFYAGPVAEALVAGVRAAGGIWTLDDLAGYQVKWRNPLIGQYHDFRIISAPLPSSGGTVLLESLNILEGLRLPEPGSSERAHLVIEAMRRAYRDRAAYLGDPDFVAAPVARLLDKAYAQELRAGIDPAHATPSSELPPLPAVNEDYPNTTHFSVIDTEGNRVAATLSINLPFGSGYTPPGTGVILNDEMDDFAAKPMTPNAYGLVGVDANAVAAGKRPLSSMSPTFVEGADRVGILGTPGGSRIISMVLLGVLSLADGADPATWVSTPRYHHQYLPDQVLHEAKAFDAKGRVALQALGHELNESSRDYGDMQAILWRKDVDGLEAASDPRAEGAATVVVQRPHDALKENTRSPSRPQP